jgi:hypothetical protein
MANRGQKNKIEYMVSTRGSVPEDLEQRISDAHARALLATSARQSPNNASNRVKEKSIGAN